MLFQYLHYISICSPLIGIIFFCSLKHNWEQKRKWIIFILLSIGVITDVACLLLVKQQVQTLWVVNLFTLFECLLVLHYFYMLYGNTKRLRYLLITVGSIFLSLYCLRNFFLGRISIYDYTSQELEFIFIFFFCLIYYFQKTKITDTIFIYSKYDFWIVSALLIYCAGTFFSFFIPSDSKETTADTLAFEYISRIGNILKNVLITIAFTINHNHHISNNSRKQNITYYTNDLKD